MWRPPLSTSDPWNAPRFVVYLFREEAQMRKYEIFLPRTSVLILGWVMEIRSLSENFKRLLGERSACFDSARRPYKYIRWIIISLVCKASQRWVCLMFSRGRMQA